MLPEFISKSCLFFTLLTLLFFCHTATSASAQKTELVDGVRIVHNDSPARTTEHGLSIHPVRKIGGRPNRFAGKSILYPFDVGLDTKGIIYVVDAGNDRIVKFDPEGNFLDTFGSEGAAPGDFSSPISIDIDEQDNVYIGDRINIRVQKVSAAGRFIDSFDAGDGVGRLRVLESGKIAMGNGIDFSYFGDVKRQKENALVRIFDPRGKITKRFGVPLVYVVQSAIISDRSFHLAVDDNNFVYIAYTHRNLIEKYSADGKLIMQIDRLLNYPVTRITLEKGKEELGTERPNYVSAGIDVDGEGRIWVMTYARQKLAGDADPATRVTDLFVFEVFSEKGILLDTIPVDAYFDHFRIFGDRLFCIDTLKNRYVREYRIVK